MGIKNVIQLVIGKSIREHSTRANPEKSAGSDLLDQEIKLLLELIEAEPVKPELSQLAQRLQNALRDRRQSGSD